MTESHTKRCKRDSCYDPVWYSDGDIARIKTFLEPVLQHAPIRDGWFKPGRYDKGLKGAWYERSHNRFFKRWVRHSKTENGFKTELVWFKPRETLLVSDMQAALDRYYKWVSEHCDCPSSNNAGNCCKKGKVRKGGAD